MSGGAKAAAIPKIVLRRGRDLRARSGHPWVYKNEIGTVDRVPQPGDAVDFLDAKGELLGRGFLNPGAFLSGRILTRKDEAIDRAFFERRIDAALTLRRQIYPRDASWRAISSEGDLLSGLIVDRYEGCLVVQSMSAGMERHLETILAILKDRLKPDAIVLRNDSRVRSEEGLELSTRTVHGKVEPPLRVGVHGITFEVDPFKGFKTGLYLDQKENWKFTRPFSEGKRVLDVFCYAGGFAVSAARFGAASVLGIDQSEEAVRQAARVANLNGVAKACCFTSANAFDAMRDLVRRRETFDLVVLDPPSFTRHRAKLPEALRGYKQIHLSALKLLRPGGHLMTFSCSYHVGRDLLVQVVREAGADLGRSVVLEQHLGQARDHPVRLECPETEYLKGMIFRAE